MKKEKEQVEPALVVGGLSIEGHHVEGVDYKTCSNCFAKLPVSNTMHELSCARMNWLPFYYFILSF